MTESLSARLRAVTSVVHSRAAAGHSSDFAAGFHTQELDRLQRLELDLRALVAYRLGATMHADLAASAPVPAP